MVLNHNSYLNVSMFHFSLKLYLSFLSSPSLSSFKIQSRQYQNRGQYPQEQPKSGHFKGGRAIAGIEDIKNS